MKIAFTKILLLTIVTTLLSSCAFFYGDNQRKGTSSSLVDYLYPDGQVPPKHEEVIPNLHLPLRVGLAFVPSQQYGSPTLPEAKKMALLEKVKKNFSSLDYVKEIVIVPETYMRSSKGFEGVDQIARLYGIDVMALVSYDQVSVTTETKSSILYWTIVGAYFIKGNENKSTTFVDTAVFDVASRKMLLRAPGVSDTEKSSTLVEVTEGARQNSEEGFELAMTNMSANLAVELDGFKERIKQDKSVQITRSEGYGGGGAIQFPLLLALAAFLAGRGLLRAYLRGQSKK